MFQHATLLRTAISAVCLAVFGIVLLGDDGSGKQEPARKDLAGDSLPSGALARMGTLRWRHGADVTFVACLPDGKGVITSDAENVLRLWDRETGKEIRRFTRPENKGSASIEIDNLNQWMMIGGPYGGVGQSVVLSPDGKVLAAASPGQPVQLWDVANGKPLRDIKVPGQGVGTIAFSPDSKILVGRGHDDTTYAWETETGKEVSKIKLAKSNDNNQPGNFLAVGGFPSAGDLAVSADGNHVAWVENDFAKGQPSASILIAERKTGKEVRRVKLDVNNWTPVVLGYSPDGKSFAYFAGDSLHLCAADSGKEQHKVNDLGNLSLIQFSPDSKMMLTRNHEGKVVLWDSQKGEKLREIDFPLPSPGMFGGMAFWGGMMGGTRDVAFAPDGKSIAIGGGHAVRFFSTETGKEVSTRAGHTSPVTQVCTAADGKTILSHGADGTIRRWDPSTGKELSSIQAPAGTSCFAASADGKTVALGNADNTIRVCDAASGKELQKITGPTTGVAVVAFSRDGKMVAARGYGKTNLGIYEAATGKQIRSVEFADENANGLGGVVVLPAGPFGGVSGPALAFSPDGGTLASLVGASPVFNQPGANEAASIELFHVATGKSRKIDLPKEHVPAHIVFSPDGRTLAVEHADGSATIVEVASGHERFRLESSPAKPATPGGVLQGQIAVNVIGGFPFGGSESLAPKVAFAQDGRMLALALGKEVNLFDLTTGKAIKNIKGHDGSITSLAFAPDGKSLVTGSSDTTLLVWDTSDLISNKIVTTKLSDKEIETAWASLENSDAAKPFESIKALVAAREQAATWLKGHLSPLAPVDKSILEKRIAELDSDDFEVRTKATQELEKLGELAVAALEKALEAKPSLEVQKRLEELIDKTIGGFHTGARLRIVRAVEVLEKINTPEATELLQALAKGAPGALQTQEAQQSLARISK